MKCKISSRKNKKQKIQARADLNSRDVEGATPLHYACRYGYSGCVKTLIAYGADMMAVKSGDGVNPVECPTILHESCYMGQLDTVACLVFYKEHLTTVMRILNLAAFLGNS